MKRLLERISAVVEEVACACGAPANRKIASPTAERARLAANRLTCAFEQD